MNKLVAFSFYVLYLRPLQVTRLCKAGSLSLYAGPAGVRP